ncbi:MAG TPA: hypothetical protein VMF11_13030 [Candidatus Baltobacteraceae bacterium]|nr:hypothetical protein [Candidatus Baltobacteraceae bacterium]
MSPDSPQGPHRPPHPLALALIGRLEGRSGACVLEIGSGAGRNTRALEGAGFRVCSLPVERPCAAALSTHALLHGTPSVLAFVLGEIADGLEPGAPLFGTFGSIRDARYGTGAAQEPHVYAPADGDEAGVAHVYFDEARLRRLLAPRFTIESMREVGVDDIAGRWAHPTAPLRGAVHWFVTARRTG